LKQKAKNSFRNSIVDPTPDLIERPLRKGLRHNNPELYACPDDVAYLVMEDSGIDMILYNDNQGWWQILNPKVIINVERGIHFKNIFQPEWW